MAKSQRTKGAAYEREVCKAFSDALGVEVKRNIGQARDGGNDIDVGPFVVECKRRRTLTTIEHWFAQAEAAVRHPDRVRSVPAGIQFTPMVVARQDGGESIVMMRLDDFLDRFGAALWEHVLAHSEAVRRGA